jgi:LysR family transcriptional activator of glutamate synthase operon
MAITISELLYFQKTAELESITKAGEELHISQPSLSRSIHALESDLGVRLFERAGRNIVLNDYGRIVKRYADHIVSQLDSMQKELSETKDRVSHTVSISLAAASTFLPGLLGLFHQTHPEIRFEIHQAENSRSPLDIMDYDLHLFSSTVPVENACTVTLLKEKLLLALPKTDERSSRKTVRLDEFAEDDFIALQKGKGLRNITDEYCRMADFTPRVVLESDSPYTVREFIKAGIGISFVPEYTWFEVREDNTIALLPVSSPECIRYICLTWNPAGYLSTPADAFRLFLIHHFKEYALEKAGHTPAEHDEAE